MTQQRNERLDSETVPEKLLCLRRLCEACGQGLYVQIIDEVVEAWNTRVPAVQDEMVEAVARAIGRTFYEGVDSGKLHGPEAFQVVAKAAIQAMSLYGEITSSESSS